MASEGNALHYVDLPYSDIHVVSSGQLEAWCQILHACVRIYERQVGQVLIPLLQAIKLGQPYCLDWAQPTVAGIPLLQRLMDLTNELIRLAPDCPNVTALESRVKQQQEWFLQQAPSRQIHHAGEPLQRDEGDDPL